jgi:hypothetical protein
MILYNYFNNINNNSINNLEIINHTILQEMQDYKTETNDDYNVCFIISCKYNRNYISYIKYYVDNIIKYYTNYLIIIVDNNSSYIDELISLFNFLNYKNIIIITNNIECKFEMGAYKMGIMYLFKNNLINKYDYYIFTQDNFVLKNKYDFNIFKNNNIFAAGINAGVFPYEMDQRTIDMKQHAYDILATLNLNNNFDKVIEECFCHSIILHKTKIITFYNYIKNLVITTRVGSISGEFYLPRMLYELNNHNQNYIDGFEHNFNINGNPRFYDLNAKYINDEIFSYFEKKLQHKTEVTNDL